jgi:dipeptidase D
MNRLNDLEPNRVFYYFEEISRIPHGSGNTKQISDYCVEFAKMHQLKYMQDASNNVIIFKPGTAGYEASEPIIIQGHLDMVCEKEHDCSIDFETEGLELVVEGDFLSAKGTTLGGDDGIAVAYALAILESEEIEHPPLEIVFTVDEEVGMLGAADLDCSSLKGKRFLNIDSEEEGYLLVSCAGGVTATCNMPLEYATDLDAHAEVWKLTVTGLQGGHSGVEIDKGRGNANQLLGRVLYALNTELGIQLISIDGGLKDNAIPRESVGVFGIVMEQETHLKELVQKLD